MSRTEEELDIIKIHFEEEKQKHRLAELEEARNSLYVSWLLEVVSSPSKYSQWARDEAMSRLKPILDELDLWFREIMK